MKQKKNLPKRILFWVLNVVLVLLVKYFGLHLSRDQLGYCSTMLIQVNFASQHTKDTNCRLTLFRQKQKWKYRAEGKEKKSYLF